MIIYSSSHDGIILDSTTLSNLGVQVTDLRGYFQSNAILDLFNNNPDCVGIRVYNINPNNEFPALLAVCVLENGADKQDDGTHIMCASINSASDSVDELTRKSAYDLIKKGYSFDVNESEKFSSFFSKEMINNLVNGSPHTGLAFYKVVWLGGRSTHLVVTSDLDNTKEIPVVGLEGTGFNNCLSDQPCPGHCANVNAEGVDVISPQPMISTADDLTSHYIPIWD